MDTQTDRQTPRDSIGRACKASRGKNYNKQNGKHKRPKTTPRQRGNNYYERSDF